MSKQLTNAAIEVFSSFDKWDAFINLIELRDGIQKVWVEKAKSKIKENFRSNEKWKVEYGNWCDVRWYLISPSSIRMNFWLSWDGNFHFVIPIENGPRAEVVKEIFGQIKYDSIRYVWGTDVQTNINFEIKLRQEGKWLFGCDYDNDLKYDRLVWFFGNETEKFIQQIKDKVEAFQCSEIVELLLSFQSEIEEKLSVPSAFSQQMPTI